jgi:hypothetical protein
MRIFGLIIERARDRQMSEAVEKQRAEFEHERYWQLNRRINVLLEHLGLVEIHPNPGVRVVPRDSEEARNMYGMGQQSKEYNSLRGKDHF